MGPFRLSFFAFALLVLPVAALRAKQTTGNYVVTRNGDTVACEFSGKFWGRIRYRANPRDGYHKIEASTIQAYHLQKNQASYWALKLPDRSGPVFVRMVQQGKISLYELLVSSNRSSTRYWYAAKGDEPLLEVENTVLFHSSERFKQNIAALVADDSKATEAFNQQMHYNFKSVQYLVRYYNSDH